jgi:hypothetical protein
MQKNWPKRNWTLVLCVSVAGGDLLKAVMWAIKPGALVERDSIAPLPGRAKTA